MCSALQSGGRQRGISLLESLIAMGVAAAALLGLLSMQTLLSCSADAAKQRSEAVRLADEQIESMRPYTKIASTPGQLAWADLAAGTDAVSTNATYMRAWTIDGSAADTLRQVTVTLSWQDRAGEAPQMVLSSVIAQMDPADVGALGFPLPANTTLKRPKNRVATEPGAFRNESHLCWWELSPTVWTDDRSPDFHAGFRNSHHLNSVLRLAAKFWQRIPLECCLIGYGVLRTELLRERYENRSKVHPSRLGCDFLQFSPQLF